MIASYHEMTDKLPMQFQIDSSYFQTLCDFLCDTVDDLKFLPECAMGSRARVITPLSLYARQSNGDWTLQEPSET